MNSILFRPLDNFSRPRVKEWGMTVCHPCGSHCTWVVDSGPLRHKAHQCFQPLSTQHTTSVRQTKLSKIQDEITFLAHIQNVPIYSQGQKKKRGQNPGTSEGNSVHALSSFPLSSPPAQIIRPSQNQTREKIDQYALFVFSI